MISGNGKLQFQAILFYKQPFMAANQSVFKSIKSYSTLFLQIYPLVFSDINTMIMGHYSVQRQQ